MVDYSRLRTVLGKLTTHVITFLKILSSAKIMTAIIVIIASLSSLALRVVPAKWGVYLNEFDPFYEYYVARKILEKGLIWWFSYTFGAPREPDKLFWYPHGRELRSTSPPGISIVSAYTYVFLKLLGLDVDLYTVHAYTPAIWASTITILGALIALKLAGEPACALSAVFLSAMPSLFTRTMLGGKHEGVAIPCMLLSLLLYLHAIGAKRTSTLILCAILSGISLGYVAVTWGGYIYPWNLLALFIMIIHILGKADKKISLAYIPTYALSTLLIAITPRYGPKVALTSLYGLLPLLALMISIIHLCGERGLRLLERLWRSGIGRFTIVSVLLAMGIILWKTGVLMGMSGRILAILSPIYRHLAHPIVESVAEHRAPSWDLLYIDYSLMLPLSLLGAYVMTKRLSRENILIVLYLITSTYAASSFARLSLFMGPAVAIVSSIGFTTLFDRLLDAIKGKVFIPRKIRSKYLGQLREVSAIGIIAICVLSLLVITSSYLPFPYVVVSTHSPPLILTSSLGVSVTTTERGYMYSDWLSALEWMKSNLPEDAIIASWWDYGYWIAVNTNRSSVCDNATLNTTQIAEVARAFLSDERTAVEIFKRLNVTHVVIFDPIQYFEYGPVRVYFPEPRGLGDFGKSYWMARIAGLDPDKYLAQATLEARGLAYSLTVPADTPEARNATLYHLLFIKTAGRSFFVFEPPPPFFGIKAWGGYKGPLVQVPPPKYFELVYISKPNGWVFVYRIKYELLKTEG